MTDGHTEVGTMGLCSSCFYLYITYLTSPPTLFYFFSINLPRAHLIHFCLLLLNWAQIGPCALGLNLTR